MRCEKCKKNMDDKDGISTIGIAISVKCEIAKEIPFMQKQMGKYKLGKEYNFCFECFIDALMGGS